MTELTNLAPGGFTSEAVSEGHPDKVADQISDAILDYCLAQDPHAHVACETLCTTNRVVVAGEISGLVDLTPAIIEKVVRSTIRDIGYANGVCPGFDADALVFEDYLHGQSPDIAMGVDRAGAFAQGAGDQGIMFGYAEGNADTDYLGTPFYYASRLMALMAHRRRTDPIGMNFLLPDGKCQFTMRETADGAVLLDTAVISQHHRESAGEAELADYCTAAIKALVPAGCFHADTRLLVNPTGRFVVGGPDGDTGVTGRKIICDTYGGVARHGGGAFSGKDPSKVDRSAAYMCRHMAKHLVAKGMAKWAEVQLGYAIGVAEPVSLFVWSDGDSRLLSEYLRGHFDCRPAAIVERLGLLRPEGWCYCDTAKNGHFGHPEFPWEKIAD